MGPGGLEPRPLGPDLQSGFCIQGRFLFPFVEAIGFEPMFSTATLLHGISMGGYASVLSEMSDSNRIPWVETKCFKPLSYISHRGSCRNRTDYSLITSQVHRQQCLGTVVEKVGLEPTTRSVQRNSTSHLCINPILYVRRDLNPRPPD